MNNQNQPFQYQPPEEPLFSKTVFFSFLVAFLVLAAIGYGIFYFVNKKSDDTSESMEEIEEKKIKKAKSALASIKIESVAEKIEEILEPAVEIVEDVVNDEINL